MSNENQSSETPRQIAERNLRLYKSKHQIDKWLEYLFSHLKKGTADKPAPRL